MLDVIVLFYARRNRIIRREKLRVSHSIEKEIVTALASICSVTLWSRL